MQQQVYTEESEVEDGRSALRDKAQALLEFDVIRGRVAESATFFPARATRPNIATVV